MRSMRKNFMVKPILAAIVSAAAVAVGSAHAAGNDNRGNANDTRESGATMTRSGNASPASTAQTQSAQATDLRASRIIGMEVRDRQGNELGEIDDLVVDVTKNRVHYAILGRGGFLEIGEEKIAVPLGKFQLAQRGSGFVLEASKKQLQSAPRLDRNLSKWDDSRYWGEVGQYYHQTFGLPPAPAPGAVTSNNRFFRGSDVLGMDVLDRTGDEIGEIEDLVVNLKDGSIEYAVLEFDRAWNPVDKLVALPMSAFTPGRERDELSLELTREQVANAPAFDRRNWPDLADAGFRDRVVGMGSAAERTLGMALPTDDSDFGRIDINNDGRLSRDEARSIDEFNRRWNAADRNRDGYLTREELGAYHSRQNTTSGGDDSRRR